MRKFSVESFFGDFVSTPEFWFGIFVIAAIPGNSEHHFVMAIFFRISLAEHVADLNGLSFSGSRPGFVPEPVYAVDGPL